MPLRHGSNMEYWQLQKKKKSRERGKKIKHTHTKKVFRTPTATIFCCFKLDSFLDQVTFTIQVFNLIDSVFVLLWVRWSTLTGMVCHNKIPKNRDRK